MRHYPKTCKVKDCMACKYPDVQTWAAESGLPELTAEDWEELREQGDMVLESLQGRQEILL